MKLVSSFAARAQGCLTAVMGSVDDPRPSAVDGVVELSSCLNLLAMFSRERTFECHFRSLMSGFDLTYPKGVQYFHKHLSYHPKKNKKSVRGRIFF